MSDQKAIGANIQAIRKKIGMSQQHLSDILDINRVELSYYETGARPVTIVVLNKFSELTGYGILDLMQEGFGEKVDMSGNPATALAHTTKEDAQVIMGFQRVVKNYCRMKRLVSAI